MSNATAAAGWKGEVNIVDRKPAIARLQNESSTDYQQATQLTVELVDHSHVPDRVTDAILETLIEMANESKINIWSLDAGLSIDGLRQLYHRHKIGAGRRRARVYAEYEIGRLISQRKT